MCSGSCRRRASFKMAGALAPSSTPSRRPKSAASLEGIALKLTAATLDDGQVLVPEQACSPGLQAAIGGVEHPLH